MVPFVCQSSKINIYIHKKQIRVKSFCQNKHMKPWNNLSDEQKRMAKISVIQTIVMSTALVIVKPIVKGEVISITDMLIEFIIFMLVLSAFNCIFIIGAKPPRK